MHFALISVLKVQHFAQNRNLLLQGWNTVTAEDPLLGEV